MAIDYEAEPGQVSHHGEEHPPTTIKQYVIIGVILTVITAFELWLSYSGFPKGPLIAALMILSAVKFVIVVALFMHLKFEHGFFTRMFAFGFVLASVILLALIALFWNNGTDVIAEYVQEPAASGGHGDEGDHGDGLGSDIEEPAPGTAPTTVKGVPVAEFFATNCAACHGANREGVIGPALTPERLTEPYGFYFVTIRDGRAVTPVAMPAWATTAGLTDEDIHALTTFIRTVEP